MNQTQWIVGGGIFVVAVALFLYVFSGDDVQIALETKTDEYTPSVIATSSSLTGTTSMESKETTVIPEKPALSKEVPKNITNHMNTAILHTTMGDITVRLYKDSAPKTVENFIKLAQDDFYNGVKFHRVIKGFMNQAGDPLSRDESLVNRWGTGGPGYTFPDEIDKTNTVYQKGYKQGILAMANSGPNTNGSQFFIMATDYPLPPLYTIFGEVIEGMSVVTAINGVETNSSDRPLVPIVINAIEVK